MKKPLKRKLGDKDLTIGSWLSFSHASLCEMMAGAGFDWLVIDMEHTSIDYREALDMIRIIDLSGCDPLVRVGENDPTVIKRVMDSGARGVVVPMVNTPEEAARAVGSVYYPPAGFRGVGLFRAQKYGAGFAEYRAWLEKEAVVIVQIEHIRAVENLKAILDVEGVDGFIVGPYDLSASLNLPGQFDHPRVSEALAEVERVMRAHQKTGGSHIVHSNPSELKAAVARGYRFLAYGDDMVFFSEKLEQERAFLRGVRNGA
jgi:2-keto-3-deoxy-L-rhamnonate aldolase RhmA